MIKIEKFHELAKKLGLEFKDIHLLAKAFTHRSYLNEHRNSGLEHNERLEFLGDAVLELAVTNFLYKTYPKKPEGDMTAYRSALVNAVTLATVAENMGLNNYLLLSKGEAKDANSKARMYILANAIEAIIGAIYLDGGTSAASKFIHAHILNHLPFILKNELYVDPKSKFQETAQELLGITPNYRVLEEQGPDHNKEFTVGVFLDKTMVAVGRGSSKQEAQVAAAQAGLEAKGWNVANGKTS